jgi:hypothetical protein
MKVLRKGGKFTDSRIRFYSGKAIVFFRSWSIRCPVLVIRELPTDWTGRSCHAGRAFQNQCSALAVVESREDG